MTVNRSRHDVVVTALIGIGIVFLLYKTYSFSPSLLPGYPGDAFFPRIIIVFILICVALVILRAAMSWARTETSGEGGRSGLITIDFFALALVTAIIGGYVLLLSVIGFEIASFLFLAVILRPRIAYEGKRAWIMTIAISAVAVLIMYVSFVLLLGVDMPLMFLPKYIDF